MEKKNRRIVCCVAALLVGYGAYLAAGDTSSSGLNGARGEEPGFDLARLAQLESQRSGGADDVSAVPLTAGYDEKEGFFISDKDKQKFLLKIGGRLQVRYTFKGASERGPNIDPDRRVGVDQSYFELERARLVFDGYVLNPNLTYFLMLDGETDSNRESGYGGVKLLDGYVLYKAGEMFGGTNKDVFAIGAGQFKPNFLRQEKTSAMKLQMVDRSLTNEYFNIDRALGAWIEGDLSFLYYSFSLINGFDSLNLPPSAIDQIPGFAGKLDFNILGHTGAKYEESNVTCKSDPMWVLGLSYAMDGNNNTKRSLTNNQKFKCYTFGIDTAFKYNVVSLQTEYVGRWVEYPRTDAASGGHGRAQYTHGFYVQGGVFLWPSVVELTGRVSTIYSDGRIHKGNGLEVGPGLNWYISGNHKVKLQSDVMFFDISSDLPMQTENLDDPDLTQPFESTAAGLESGEKGVMWRLQLQLMF